MQPKIGSYRLPTHERSAHRNFFTVIPSYFRIEILAMRYQTAALGTNGLILGKVISSSENIHNILI